jgi:hypothetical protein
MKAALTCTVLFFIAASATADAHFDTLSWVPGGGQRCDTTCGRDGKTAITSGKYKNGEPFFVCIANPGGEGWRAGYNVWPVSDSVCTVGYGQGEHGISPYFCLCRRRE